MSIPHAAPGEVISVRPLGEAVGNARTATLIKTTRLEVLRLILPAGKEIPTHKVQGEITVHCLEGRAAFTALGRTQELAAGQMLFLPGGEEHSIRGVEDASVLVTLQLAAGTSP